MPLLGRGKPAAPAVSVPVSWQPVLSSDAAAAPARRACALAGPRPIADWSLWRDNPAVFNLALMVEGDARK
jgi:hypothetical protein